MANMYMLTTTSDTRLPIHRARRGIRGDQKNPLAVSCATSPASSFPLWSSPDRQLVAEQPTTDRKKRAALATMTPAQQLMQDQRRSHAKSGVVRMYVSDLPEGPAFGSRGFPIDR